MYAKSLKLIYAEEVRKLRQVSPGDERAPETLKPWLQRDEKMLPEPERMKLVEMLSKSRALQTMYFIGSQCAAAYRPGGLPAVGCRV